MSQNNGPLDNGSREERSKRAFEEWAAELKEKGITVSEETDPEIIAQMKTAAETYHRNEAWMDAHWEEMFPQAKGKMIAVAGQEAFIADTTEEALAKAHAAHPEERAGVVCRYVFPDRKPRIYVGRG